MMQAISDFQNQALNSLNYKMIPMGTGHLHMIFLQTKAIEKLIVYHLFCNF